MNISIDTGNSLSVLAALLDQRNAQLIVNAAAERYNDDIHDWIDAGRGFTPRTGGGLEQSINWHPNGDGSATVYANKAYAGYVEKGTRPHVIRPRAGRQALRFPVSGGGGFGFARVIHHPGSKPHPYFFIDLEARRDRMQAAALSVLASRITGGHYG